MKASWTRHASRHRCGLHETHAWIWQSFLEELKGIVGIEDLDSVGQSYQLITPKAYGISPSCGHSHDYRASSKGQCHVPNEYTKAYGISDGLLHSRLEGSQN